MTRKPKQNKNHILNNLDKYIIDGKGNFVNLEKDYSDNDYVIWKSEVKDYKEVREEIIKKIIEDKKKWKLISDKEVIEDIMEAILLEKENWEIVCEANYIGGKDPKFYKYRSTGEKLSATMYEIFNFDQSYILIGELGHREHIWKDYHKERQQRYCRTNDWWEKRKRRKKNLTNATSQSETSQTENQNPTSEQTNPETEQAKQENQNSKSTPPPTGPTNNEIPLPQEVKDNLNKACTGTEEEKKQAWENLEKEETQKSYQENKEAVEKLKKEKATENPQEYSKEVKQKIEEKLKNNGVKESELNSEAQWEWKKLKGGEIKDPNQLVEIETKITSSIYQKGAQKKITDLTSKVNQVLASKSNQKTQIDSLKKELLAFISSSNIYYAAHKKEMGKLLTQLEKYSNVNNEQNTSTNPKNSPWKVVIPFVVVGLILIVLAIPPIRKRIKTKKKVK